MLRSNFNLLVNRLRHGPIKYFHYSVPRLFRGQASAAGYSRPKPLTMKARKEYKSALGMIKMAELIQNHVGKRNLTDEEWCKLKEVATVEMNVDPVVFESLLMTHLRENLHYQLARSFFQFIKKCGKPNLMTLSHYIALCGKCIDQSSEEEIMSVLDEIPSDARANQTIAKCVVLGLVQTSHWARSLDIIKNSNVLEDLAGDVAAAAFRNNDFETAWKLLDELFQSEVKSCAAFEACVTATDRMGSRRDVENLLTKMLSFCRNNHVLLSHSCAQKLKQVFQSRFSMRGNIAINKSNVCTSCGTKLERNDLTSLELLSLQVAFKSKVVIGSNVFLQSTPSEVDRFFKFIENCKPCDIVVDGLNVAYNMGNGRANVSEMSAQLRNVLQYFTLSELNRIVMIGRVHMHERWPHNLMADIEKMATCFYAEDISKDDPFLLYAALFSGPNTYFLSNDIFNDHRFKLGDDNVRRLFDRWRLSRQILFPTKARGKPVFQMPLKHGIQVQGSFKRGWHIPVFDRDDKELGSYDYCKHWLCVDNK